MIILFIDDEDYRHDLAEKHLDADHTLLHAYNYDQAMDIFKARTDIDLACFDHDLGDYVQGTYGMDERNGSMLAFDLLYNLPEANRPKQVIVHSFNPSGSKNIVSKFKSAGIPVRAHDFSEWLMVMIAHDLHKLF
jgi:hypothetical protein